MLLSFLRYIYIADYVQTEAIASTKVKPVRVELALGCETTAKCPGRRLVIFIIILFLLDFFIISSTPLKTPYSLTPKHHTISSTPRMPISSKYAFGGRNLISISNSVKKSCLQNFASDSKIAVWNARSVSSKSTSICDFVLLKKLDILVLNETWLKNDWRNDCFLLS